MFSETQCAARKIEMLIEKEGIYKVEQTNKKNENINK